MPARESGPSVNICKTRAPPPRRSPPPLQAPLRARRQGAAAPARAHPADLPRLRAPPARPPARARRAPARLRRGCTADVKSRCHRCCCCFGGNKRRLCGECRGGARAVWRWCQRTARRRRKRLVRSRVTRGCRLGCSLRVYLDRRARALRFVLRRLACCCRAAASSALSRGSWLRSRPSQERVCCLEPAWRSWRAPARRLQQFALPLWCRWTHFFLNCQNRLSEQANLDSKLKVEVCVRTGTKFVSEQGLRLNVRVSPWRLGGRAACVESLRGSEGDFKTGRGKERGNWERQNP